MMHCASFDVECPYCEQECHIIVTSSDDEDVSVGFCPFCGSELFFDDEEEDDEQE